MTAVQRLLACSLLVLTWGTAAHAAGDPGGSIVYVGTYTGAKSKGIYMARLNAATGALSAPELAAEVGSPNFLALHPTGNYLYAVGEAADAAGKRGGATFAFSVDPDSGKLTPLNQQSSRGDNACHVSVNATGKVVLTANYGSGTVAALPVGDDGKLGEPSPAIKHQGKTGPNSRRQDGPHAHFITTDPGDRFALACDLGLDTVQIYKLDRGKATLTPNDPPSAALPPGGGPRHLSFHPNGKFVYVNNELDSSVTAFAWDAERGAMKTIHTAPTLPADFAGKADNTTAQILAHPSGKWVYCSNRGHDSIAAFTVDEKTGKLTPAGHTPTGGKTPRNFNVDPSGKWMIVANQSTDNLVVFRIDPKTGALEKVGEPLEVPSPVCVVFKAR